MRSPLGGHIQCPACLSLSCRRCASRPLFILVACLFMCVFPALRLASRPPTRHVWLVVFWPRLLPSWWDVPLPCRSLSRRKHRGGRLGSALGARAGCSARGVTGCLPGSSQGRSRTRPPRPGPLPTQSSWLRCIVPPLSFSLRACLFHSLLSSPSAFCFPLVCVACPFPSVCFPLSMTPSLHDAPLSASLHVSRTHHLSPECMVHLPDPLCAFHMLRFWC